MLAVVSFLAACQKDNALQGTTEDAWVYDVTLPVPIQFGSSSSSPLTKAIVDGIEDIGTELGIFGVDHEAWKGVEGTYTAGKFLFNDKDVHVVLAGIDDNKKTVAFDGGERFYPLYSQNNYTFYGYYPYREIGSSGTSYAILDDSGYKVKYDIGTTDILWAQSKAEPFANLEGYNARYIRKIREHDAVYEARKPNLDFKHLLTALDFSIISDELQAVKNVEVTGIKVLNTYTDVVLMVSSNADATVTSDGKNLYGTGSGTFLYDDEGSKAGSVDLTIPDDVPSCNHGTDVHEAPKGYYATTKGLPLGTMMLPPEPSILTSEEQELYKIESYDSECFYAEVSFRDASNKYQSIYQVTFKLPLEDLANGAGKRYSVAITVRDLMDIDVAINVNDWDEGFVDPGNLNLGNDDKPETEQYIYFAHDNVSIKQEATSGDIFVFTDGDWKAEVTAIGNEDGLEPVSETNPSWLELTKNSGGPNTYMNFTTSPNETMESRIAEITVSLTDKDPDDPDATVVIATAMVTVTQAGLVPTITAVKTLDFESADVPSAETTLTVNYETSDLEVAIAHNPGKWINSATVKPVEGSTTTYELVVKADANTTGFDQSGTIVIRDSMLSVDPITITVRREASSTGSETEPSS